MKTLLEIRRELQVNALKLKSKFAPNATASRGGRFFNFKRNTDIARTTSVGEPYDVHIFTRDSKSALGRFRVSFHLMLRHMSSVFSPGNTMFCWRQTVALPLYAISPIEAVMHSFGLISNSTCPLDKFIDWMLDHRQLVDYRFGFVQSVHIYRGYTGPRDNNKTEREVKESIIIGLRNNRGIKNWVRVTILHSTVISASCVRTLVFLALRPC